MFVEQREEQDLNRDGCSQTDRSIPYHETRELALNSFARIRLHANSSRGATFCNLFNHLKVENFREAFRALIFRHLVDTRPIG
jgi:hypothetical protein